MLSGIGTVLLVVLKVIGILLLVILALLLLMIFVPIRYKALVEKQEGTLVKGAVSWFGLALRIPFWMEENALQYKIKIFGIPYSGKNKKNKKKTTANKGKKKEEKSKKTEADKAIENPEKSENKTGKTSENRKRNKKSPKGKSKEKKSLRQRLSEWKELILDIFKKIKKMTDGGKSLIAIMTSDEGKGFVCIIKENLLYLWKKIRPRIRGWVVFGTGDPCSTGEILGGVSMCYGWIGRQLEIAPDFEQERLEGHLVIRGRITIFTLLLIAYRVLTNKDFKKTYSRLKKWKESI